MRVALIGWYGHSNYGDQRMLYCIQRFFSKCSFFVVSGLMSLEGQLEEVNRCDFVIIGGGSFIFRNAGIYKYSLLKIKKPLLFLGISIEAYHRDMEDFFGVIKSRAELIIVRDRRSKEYLGNHPKVLIAPDVSFLYPFDIVGETIEDICGLNLRPWYYWKSVHGGSYYLIMARINDLFPFIKRFYPFAKWSPERAVGIIRGLFKKVKAFPFYFGNGGENDRTILAQYLGEAPAGFDATIYSRIRYLIGMRYHSVIFALQSGIPFISLSYQPKSANFCSDIGMDMLSVDIYNIKSLPEKITYLKDNYRKIRSQLIQRRAGLVSDAARIFKANCQVYNFA